MPGLACHSPLGMIGVIIMKRRLKGPSFSRRGELMPPGFGWERILSLPRAKKIGKLSLPVTSNDAAYEDVPEMKHVLHLIHRSGRKNNGSPRLSVSPQRLDMFTSYKAVCD